MKAAAGLGEPAPSKSGLRIIPEGDLHSAERISRFLRREIAELQSSGGESDEMQIGIDSGEAGGRPMEERLVTIRMDGERTVVVQGLLKNPLRLPIRKSPVGPVQLISDEIRGTYLRDPF